MCPETIKKGFKRLFGMDNTPPPVPAMPTAPPTPQETQTAPSPTPSTPTPSPYSEDETKRKAKITGKKVQKKKRSAGTSQLQTKKGKPATGGLQGINTPQGVNTGGQAAPAQQTQKQP
jgi:hypothetical protein